MGKTIDFVVCGGIGSIESPRFIRALRRRGAKVQVWMTPQAGQFVSSQVFEWASGEKVISDFSGEAKHVAQSDAVVLSACTANSLSKLSHGIADSAALTLCQSALGRLPFILQPTMHDSLHENVFYQSNRERLLNIERVAEIPSRNEESKRKMLDPEESADFTAHHILKNGKRAIVLMGPTRSAIDEVRFVSNHSSGRMGTRWAEALFRWGFDTKVVSGPAQVLPTDLIPRKEVVSADEMHRAFEVFKSEGSFELAVFCAAVLDFEVMSPRSGKLTSTESLSVELRPSAKLLDELASPHQINIAFKLEAGLSDEALQERVRKWQSSSSGSLSYVVANHLSEARQESQRVWLFDVEKESFRDFPQADQLVESLVPSLATRLTAE